MAGTHEGYSLGLKANFTQVEEAKKATKALYSALGEVEKRANSMHMSNNLPKEINHIDTVTASYIRRLESEGKTYEANQQKVNAYRSAVSELNDKQKSLSNELDQIAKKTGVANDAYRTQQIKINQTVAEMNRYKAGMKSAQAEMDKLHPTGFNKWVAGANKVNHATSAMKSKLHDAWDNIKGGATVATGAIGAVGAAAFTGAKKAGAIQQTYREINNLAVLGGEKQKEVLKAVTRMQSQGRDMSIKYGKSQQDIAAGYEDLIKRGYTTKQALGAMRTELQASVASGDKFSDVTTVSSQVLDAFGMRAKSTAGMIKNTKEVVNELAYSADATSTGFSDLGVAMSYVGTAAKANKISLAETSAALGVLSNNGLESDKAGTALRSTINGLTNQINKIGTKNSIFTKLGIKKSEMLDAHGNLKSLSQDMGVLYKHIEEHSKGGSEENGFFKSIFGTSGMNGAEILAKSSKETGRLSKRIAEAGKNGSYVAKLAAKNMSTARGSAASARQAMSAFQMTLGRAVLPAINQASNALAKFLLSKDGKKFQKDVGGAVGKVANGLVSLVKWTATHKKEVEWVGKGLLVDYSALKAAEFIRFLGKTKTGIEELKDSSGILNSLAGAVTNLNIAESGGSGSGFLGKLNIFKRAKGPEKVIKAGAEVKSPGLIRRTFGNAKATVQDIPYMLPGSGAIRSIGGKMLSPIRFVGRKLKPAARPIKSFENSKMAQRMAGTKFGSRALGAVKGLGTGMNVMAGVGVAATSGYDIYTALKSKNKKTKFTNLGKGIGSAIGGGIGLYFGGPGGAAIGTALGKIAGGWAGKMVTGFKKSKFGKAISRQFSKTWYSVKLTAKGAFKSVGKDLRSLNHTFGRDFKSMNRATKPLQNFFKAGFVAVVRLGIKTVGSTLKRGIKVAVGVFHAFTSGVKLVGTVIKGTVTVASDLLHGKWRKAWKDFGKYGGKAIKDFKGVLSGLWKAVKNTFGWIWDTVKNVWDFATGKDWKVHAQKGTTPSVSGAHKSVARMKSGAAGWSHARKSSGGYSIARTNRLAHLNSHARGGSMHTTHHALVGEAGPELAYKNGSHARLLGANGPEITRVHSGEHILNAKDTHKVLNGGLGRGLILKGYADGNTKLAKKTTNDYKDTTTKSSKLLAKFARKSKSTWKGVTTQTSKQTSKTRKNTVNDFEKITRQTNKQTDKTRKNSINDYTNMRKGVHKQMDAMHDSVISLAGTTSKGFGKSLGKMKGYAHDAMSNTIGQVNKGISGIDKVLGQFGGNTSVIKPVKFATGTDANGRLTQDTLAMVNDAKTGPRQEAIVTEKNEIYYPRGKNTIIPLKKGWGVLNGTQTKQVSKSAGFKRFAKGSGISHSLLKKIASKGEKSPAQSFANMYTHNVHASGPDLNHGTTDLAKNSSTKLGVPWMTAMWSVINDAIGGASGKGGTREAFLKYAEETFSGVRYVMGAASKTASDCSGMVMQALRRFGISIGRSTVDMQHSSGVRYLGKSLSNTIPGDLVIFGHGTGAAGHVGIIKNPKTGTMFNETPPHARVTDIASDKGMGYGYYRVRGLHNAVSNKKTAKASKSLETLAKHELGSSALKWIKDKLGDEGDLGGNIGGEGVKRWAGTVRRILGMLHLSTSNSMVARVLRQIQTESDGNPNARQPGADPDGDGSGPALGLMQTKRATFNAFKRKGSGGIFNGPANIYAGLNYAKHRYGPSLSALGNGHGYAKGGKPKAHTPFIAGERGPELVTADGPVKVDTHEQTKRKLSDLSNLVNFPKVQRPTRISNSAPVININFNGPIGGTVEDAKKIAEIVKQEITKYFVNIGDEFGLDPSLY